MAAPASFRPPTYDPSQLSEVDASKVVIKPNGKWFSTKGLPSVLLRGTAKFITSNESGKTRIGLAITKADAESLSSFCQTHLLPALASSLSIPEPNATPLGRVNKKPKSSPPSANATAITLKFSFSIDKYDPETAIVNFFDNSITTYHQVNTEKHTVQQVLGLTRMAQTEVTGWLSVTKNEKEAGLYYVNIMPKTIVFAPSLEPVKEEEIEPPLSFGGEMYPLTQMN